MEACGTGPGRDPVSASCLALADSGLFGARGIDEHSVVQITQNLKRPCDDLGSGRHAVDGDIEAPDDPRLHGHEARRSAFRHENPGLFFAFEGPENDGL